MLLFIALFVWTGASAEWAHEETRASLARVTVADLEIARFDVVGADAPLGEVASKLTHGFQHDFPVVEAGRIVGVLSRRRLESAIAELGPDAPSRDAMRPGVAVIDVDAPAERALAVLHEEGGLALVARDGRVEGLVTAEALADRLVLERALHARSAA